MPRLRVLARNNVSLDPIANRHMYKRGDFVSAWPDGRVFTGDRQRLPYSIVLNVSGISLATARARVQQWDYEYDFEIMQRSVPLDGWRFRVTSLQRRASDGECSVETAMIRPFFERWGASFVRRDPTGVVLDWAIADGAMSRGFLGVDAAGVGVALSETAYDETSGLHTFAADYSAVPVERQPKMGVKIARRVISLGGDFIDDTGTLATYRLPRDRVRTSFQESITDARSIYKRRRYTLMEADVQLVIDAGGEMDVTAAQLAARVIDHRAL